MFTSPLIAANLYLKNDEKLLIILVNQKNFLVAELCRNSDGYNIVDQRFVEYNSKSTEYSKIKNEILGSCLTPKRIIAVDPKENNQNAMKNLQKNILKSKKLISLTSMGMNDLAKIVETMVKKMDDPLFNDFHIIPKSKENFFVVENSSSPKVFLHIKNDENLPITKSCVTEKSIKSFFVGFLNIESKQIEAISENEITIEKCHRINLILTINENNFPIFQHEPFIIPEIQSLPEKFNTKLNMNTPVIGLFDNSSVICIPCENGYEFMESWNGLHGNDIYLSFEEEKPKLIKTIQEIALIKENCMIYDLLKILSMSHNDIKTDEEWKFKITKNDENPILLEFDTFDGTRKASPIFLMPLILKEHIKQIKNETGKRPTELGFCVFNVFSLEEITNVKNGLEEACNLMKVKFTFVDDL